MGNEIDEALDRMTPQELTEFEGALDKKSSDAKVASLYAAGVQMAREAVSHYEKTSELDPVLVILKGAAEGKLNDPIDAELDKMSADELVQLEKELDQTLSVDKTAEEYAANYIEVGRKMARDWYEGHKKTAAGAPRIKIPKTPAIAPPAPGLGSKLMNIAKEHPLATAGAGMGMGYLLGDRK